MNLLRNRPRVFALAVFLGLFSLLGTSLPAKGASAGLSQVLSVASSNFTSPTDLVVGGDHIWVLSQGNKRIVKVDRFTGAVLGSTASMADTPHKLAWDGSRLWVSFISGGKIARVNQDLTFSVSSTVCTSPLFNDSVAAANGRVFVACWNTSLLAELNPDTLAVAQSTPIGSMPFGLRANDSKVYVDTGNQVRIFTVDSIATAPIVVNTGMPTNSSHQMTLDSDYFWMVGNNTGQTAKLGRLRLSDNSVTLYTVSTVANAAFSPIATDGRFVYLPNSTESAFSSFDIVASTWQVEVANTSPTGVATTPGEVWAILGGALIKYSTNVQSVTWSPSNISNALANSPITPNVQATSSGAGAISYAVASAGTAQCAVNSSTGVVSALSVGTCTIRAISAATANESAGFTDVVFTFSAQAQTVTWSPTNTSSPVSAATLTPDNLATSSGSGAISYSVQSAGGTGCQVNSATAVLTFTTAGNCVVRATAAASGGFALGSTDVTFSFVQLVQTVTWSPNTNVTRSMDFVNPSALATSSGPGAISYSVQSAGATACAINSSTGIVRFAFVGTCVLRATAAASGGYPSAFVDVTFQVTLPSQTVTWSPAINTFVSSNLSNSVSPRASTSGQGNITYSIVSSGGTGCTVSILGNVRGPNPGTCVVRATADTAGGQSEAFAEVTFTFLATQTVTWSPTNLTSTLPVVSIIPSSGAVSTGPGVVSYSVQSAGATGCTVNSTTGALAVVSAGTCVVRATAAATSTYAAGFVDVNFVVQPDPNAVSVSQIAAQGESGLQIFGLSPRVVRLGETPTVTLLTSLRGASGSATIGGITSSFTISSNGQATFALPKLSVGVYFIDYVFTDVAHLRFQEAVEIVEQLPVKRLGVDVVSRITILPTSIQGNDIVTETKQTIVSFSQALGPVFTMKCTAFVTARENNAKGRKVALGRAKTVCGASARALSAATFATQVKVVRQTMSNSRQVLLELVFKR